MERFASSQKFRIWDWRVSHSQLLIRSSTPGQNQENSNTDLIFKGVFYTELPDTFVGIEVDTPTEDELATLETRTNRRQDGTHRYYVLCTGDRRFYVGAAYLRTEINRLAPMETSLDTF